MTIFSILLSYLLSETIIASSRIIDWIDIFKRREFLSEVYQEEHNFFFNKQSPDPEIGYVNGVSTNEKKREEEYLSGETDERGYRNSPGDKEKGKIVVIGDSFSYGFGVSVDKSWPKRLSSRLGVRVANLAVDGYNPTQYNLTMRKYKEYLKRRIILYGIYINDFTDQFVEVPKDYYEASGRNKFKSSSPSFSDLGAFIKKKSLLKRTLVYSLYQVLFYPESKRGALINGEVILREGENEIQEGWLSKENKSNFIKTLQTAKDTAVNYNSTLVVVHFPSRAHIYSKEYISKFSDEKSIELERTAERILENQVQKMNLPFINLTNVLERERKIGAPAYLFIDGHLNPHGNEVVAEEIANKLIEWGYVKLEKNESENTLPFEE